VGTVERPPDEDRPRNLATQLRITDACVGLQRCGVARPVPRESGAEHRGVFERKVGALPVVWMNGGRRVADEGDPGPDARHGKMRAAREEAHVVERTQVGDDPLCVRDAAQVGGAPRIEIAVLHRVAVLSGDVVKDVGSLARGITPSHQPLPQ